MIKLTKYKQVEKGGKKPQSTQRTQRKVSGINYQVLVHLNHPWNQCNPRNHSLCENPSNLRVSASPTGFSCCRLLLGFTIKDSISFRRRVLNS